MDASVAPGSVPAGRKKRQRPARTSLPAGAIWGAPPQLNFVFPRQSVPACFRLGGETVRQMNHPRCPLPGMGPNLPMRATAIALIPQRPTAVATFMSDAGKTSLGSHHTKLRTLTGRRDSQVPPPGPVPFDSRSRSVLSLYRPIECSWWPCRSCQPHFNFRPSYLSLLKI